MAVLKTNCFLLVSQSVYRNPHDGVVRVAAISEDGCRLVTGGDDTLVCVWKWLTRKEKGALESLGISPDVSFRRLAARSRRRHRYRHLFGVASQRSFGGENSADSDNETGRLVFISSLHGHMAPPTALAVSAAFGLIATGSRDRTIIVWDLHRLEHLRRFTGFPGPISALAFNHATGDLVACSRSSIYVWDVNGTVLVTHEGLGPPSSHISSLAVVKASGYEMASSCNLIITGHYDGNIKLWDVVCINDPLPAVANDLSSFSPVHDAAKGSGKQEAYSDPSPAAACGRRGDIKAKSVPRHGTFVSGARVSPFEHWALVHRGTLRQTQIPITALYVSADACSIWSGDAAGRVLRWSVPDSLTVAIGTVREATRAPNSGDEVLSAADSINAYHAVSVIPAGPCNCKKSSSRFEFLSGKDSTSRRCYCSQCGELLCNMCRLSHLREQHPYPSDDHTPASNPSEELFLRADHVPTSSSLQL